jgi:hypothetical protein
MREMRPYRNFLRPHGRSDELWCDNKRVAAVLVTDEIGERSKSCCAFAGTKRSDEEGCVVLVEKCCGSLLEAIQGAHGEGRMHDFTLRLF